MICMISVIPNCIKMCGEWQVLCKSTLCSLWDNLKELMASWKNTNGWTDSEVRQADNVFLQSHVIITVKRDFRVVQIWVNCWNASFKWVYSVSIVRNFVDRFLLFNTVLSFLHSFEGYFLCLMLSLYWIYLPLVIWILNIIPSCCFSAVLTTSCCTQLMFPLLFRLFCPWE